MAIAATQSAGMQQNRGTMCKSFHAGKAASSGVLAALLAERGFDGSLEIIEGKRGYCRIYSDAALPDELVQNLGTGWGNRAQRTQTLCLRRRSTSGDRCGDRHTLPGRRRSHAHRSDSAARQSIGDFGYRSRDPPDPGLQSKFSIYHSAAVAWIDGATRIPQYTDERAGDPAVVALRQKIKVTTDPSLRGDQAEAVATVAGVRHRTFVEHASGTADNPMSDAEIEAEFWQRVPVIGPDRARRVRDLVQRLDRLADVRELSQLCA